MSGVPIDDLPLARGAVASQSTDALHRATVTATLLTLDPRRPLGSGRDGDQVRRGVVEPVVPTTARQDWLSLLGLESSVAGSPRKEAGAHQKPL
ncbi:MAG TPA: hypothetical protein DCS55_08055 [Acidimicrobiaceae bacterium]|nr:hypothetical protein [Acidimicrobiaceae bacterium]